MAALETRRLPADEVPRLAPLVAASRFKPLRYLPGIGEGELEAFWLETIREQAGDGGGFVCLRDSRPVGLAVAAPLGWDSEALGRRIFGLQQLVVAADEARPGAVLDSLLDGVLAWAGSAGGEALHCKRFADDVAGHHALERAGFHLMDTMTIYLLDLRADAFARLPSFDPPPGCRIRPATAADLGGLVELARAAFGEHFHRFHVDEGIPREAAVRVYERWLRSDLEGHAQWVVVAEVDGRIAACTTWRQPTPAEAALSVRPGHFSIGAVHPDFHRRGLFTMVTSRVPRQLPELADWLEAPVHANNPATHRAFARLGWRYADATHSFHRWLVPPATDPGRER